MHTLISLRPQYPPPHSGNLAVAIARSGIACTLVGLLFAAGCKQPDEPLLPPTQISPASGSVFDAFPRTTTLVWTSVPRAGSYSVEVDPWCADKDMWCSEAGAAGLLRLDSGIKDTTHTFEHVGAQRGRWRVWAVSPTGATSPKTEWRPFVYTR